MVARDGVEIGAGDADRPGLLRVRGGVDEAGRIGLGLARAERVLPGLFQDGSVFATTSAADCLPNESRKQKRPGRVRPVPPVSPPGAQTLP